MRSLLVTLMVLLGLGCIPPEAPRQPLTGPGGQDYPFGDVSEYPVGQGATGASVFVPRLPTSDEPLPLVVFLHGYQGEEPLAYRAWLRHLSRRGAVVVYPTWQHPFSVPEKFTQNAADGIQAALDWITKEGVHVDLNRVTFVGHSAGGALAVNLSVWSVDGRLGVKPQAMLVAAPGRCFLARDQSCRPAIPMENLESIPPDLNLVVMDYSDDTEVGHSLARAVFTSAVQIPRSNRTYLQVRSDETGFPSLTADHRAAAAPVAPLPGEYVTNSLDYFGTWKLADALMACTFERRHCDVALGEGDAQKDMGRWSDGTPVKPMLNQPPPD